MQFKTLSFSFHRLICVTTIWVNGGIAALIEIEMAVLIEWFDGVCAQFVKYYIHTFSTDKGQREPLRYF